MSITIYDTKDEDALATQGYKPYKDSTLKSMSKDDLIDQIRCLEHNWAGEIKACWLQSNRLAFTEQIFEDVIKDIEAYNPEYSELDYDYEDNAYLDYHPVDIDYIIKNVLETYKIDEPFREEQLFGNVGFFNRFLNDRDGFIYFTEEEQEAVDKYIKEHRIEPKDNFYDYYEEEEKKNE